MTMYLLKVFAVIVLNLISYFERNAVAVGIVELPSQFNLKHFAGHIIDNTSVYFENIANLTAKTDAYKVDFKITFPVPVNNNCPVLYIRHPMNLKSYGTHQRCFEKSEVQSNLEFDKHIWWFANCGILARVPAICKIDTKMKLVNCQDELEIANGFKTTWHVAIGYMCEDRQSHVNIKYDISIQDLPTIECRPLDENYSFQAECRMFYPYYAVPNLLGYDQNEVIKIKTLLVNLYLSCYKHFLEFSCRTLLPECDPKTKTIVNSPCQQMCQDWLSGCPELVSVRTECNLYVDSLDPSQCIYRNVTCDGSKLPPNFLLDGNYSDTESTIGSLENVSYLAGESLNLSCYGGYQLHGNRTVRCLYTSQWSSMPECIITAEQKVINFVAASVLPTVVLALLLTSVILYRKFRLEIKAIVKHGPLKKYFLKIKARYWKSEELVVKKYHAYVCCSEEPQNSENQFIQVLREKLPNAKLFVETEIHPGQMEMTEKLDALYESSTFILLLSDNNTMTDSFIQIFQFAQEIHGRDRNFRFLVIKFQEDSQIECLPDFVKRYLKYGSIFGYVDEIQFRQTGSLMWKMVEEVLFM